jgi:Na+/melibiose symporter-like transporter
MKPWILLIGKFINIIYYLLFINKEINMEMEQQYLLEADHTLENSKETLKLVK